MNIYIVDAFTDTPYKGNPAAVCILESEISIDSMQLIANEMNLSETAFLLRQGKEFTLRWFTPEAEVDLCGHATLASAHILWEEQYFTENEIRFNTKSGLLTASKDLDWIQMNFPLEIEHECIPPTELIDGLGVNYTYVGKNRLDYIVEVEDEEVVRNLQPDFVLWRTVRSRGIIVTSRSNRNGIDFVSRCFYPEIGVDEDPVTGSAHCCLGPYWQSKLNKNELVAVQTSRREGLLKLKIMEGRILIIGQAVTTLRGTLTEKNPKKIDQANHLSISMLTSSDMESVFRIYEVSIPDAFEKDGLGLLIDDIQNEIENKKQLLQASLDQSEPDTYFMCAKRNEEVIGVICFGPCGEDIRACTNHQLDDVGELGSLYVLPSYQGQGVGSALIKAMVTYLEKQGIDRFCLDSGYKDAQKRWLRKFGEPYQVVKDYWGEDTTHMVWLCKVIDFCDRR